MKAGKNMLAPDIQLPYFRQHSGPSECVSESIDDGDGMDSFSSELIDKVLKFFTIL